MQSKSGWILKMRGKKTLIRKYNPIAKDLRTSKYQTRVNKNKKKEVKNDPGFDKRSVPDGW